MGVAKDKKLETQEKGNKDNTTSEYVQLSLPKLPLKKLTINHLLILLLLIAAYFIGTLTTRVNYLEQNSTLPPTQTVGEDTTQPEDAGPIKVSVDDDPVLGDENAPVTMIDFSDYECPFCKRYFDETFAQLKKEYIDTGKVKYVYRDLPLPFHDPLATQEAIAANCAREQGGDEMYFAYHDEIFMRTKSNGNGLTTADLSTIALDLGLQLAPFQSCFESEKYSDEIQKDLADASAYGATATPTFFIGKSDSSGTFTATKLVGAQPYSAFKAILDQQLK